MLVLAKGNCPICGKSYSDFGTITEQEVTFYCERCETRYEMCPDCKRRMLLCLNCGGELLDSWKHLEKKFGARIIF